VLLLRFFIFISLLVLSSSSIMSQNIINSQEFKDIKRLRSLSENNELSMDERLENALEAVKLSEEIAIDTVLINSNRALSTVYLYRGDYVKFRNVNFKNLDLAVQAKDSLVIGIVNLNLGWFHHYTMVQNDSAYAYYSEAAKIYDKIGANDRQFMVLSYMADIQETEKDYLGAEANAIKAIKILNDLPKTEDNLLSSWVLYNLLGIINLKLEMYDESLAYHEKAYEIAKRKEVSLMQEMTSLNNMAFAYRKLHDYEKALSLYTNVLDYKDRYNKTDPTFYPLVLENFAFTKFEANHQDIINIENMLKDAYQISDSLSDPTTQLAVSIDLAKFYLKNTQKDSALVYAKKSYNLANEISSYDILLESMQLLSEIKKGDQGKKYLNKYIALSDSLLNNERNVRNKFARIEFETDLLAEENERISRERLWLSFTSVALLITLLLLYIVITQRAKNKELMFLKNQQEANEEIYNLMLSQQEKLDEVRHSEKKRISQELHDGILGRLFGTRLSLDSLNFNEGMEAVKKRANYLVELKTIEEEIRRISHDLNNDFVSGSRFMDILSELIDKQSIAYKLKYKFNYTDNIDWEIVSNKIKISLYRIVQESLQNIYKHAEAKEVNISIQLKKSVILMIISDNGKGFDLTKSKKGIGLKNITSRVNQINGSVNFSSEENKGTTITIKAPY